MAQQHESSKPLDGEKKIFRHWTTKKTRHVHCWCFLRWQMKECIFGYESNEWCDSIFLLQKLLQNVLLRDGYRDQTGERGDENDGYSFEEQRRCRSFDEEELDLPPGLISMNSVSNSVAMSTKILRSIVGLERVNKKILITRRRFTLFIVLI